jgi:hypothetical protein
LAQAELFGEYVVDFKYILIDVNRYDERELWEVANLIGGVFLLDQNVAPEVYHQRMISMAPIFKQYAKPVLELFFQLVCDSNLPGSFPEKQIGDHTGA